MLLNISNKKNEGHVFSLTVVAKVPGSWKHPTSPLSLSSLWGLAARPAVGPGPGGGLHKVVGDLPLVLKQVFCLGAVRITCDSGKSEESGDINATRRKALSPHLRGIRTCTLCGRRTCTDTS